MSYKIVVDSCCELPEKYKKDPHFEIIPLGLEVGDYRIMDDEHFNQKEFSGAGCGMSPVPAFFLSVAGELSAGV